MPIELKIPTIGESISEVFIGTWLKKEGEAVAKDEPIVEIESDKATVELPAPVSGSLIRILKTQGESAAIGDVIAQIERAPDSPKEKSTAPLKKTDKDEQAAARPVLPPKPTAPPGKEKRVMPAAEKLMAEKGLSPEAVKASGPGGRILKEDVLRAEPVAKPGAEETPPRKGKPSDEKPLEVPEGESPPQEAAQEPLMQTLQETREEEVIPMTPMRRAIAQHLLDAQRNTASLTTFNEVDMSAVNALRKQFRENFQERYGTRLGLMSFFVKAVVDALKMIPQLNAEVRGTDIVYRNYYDIGIAVSSQKGLVVPILRSAERMSFAEIEKAISDLAERAQRNRIRLEELEGGTFTITNGGVFGSLLSTPIINPPQSGILGLHAIQDRPVVRDGAVVVRPMMYIALTYDHRIVDGREAVIFLRRIREAIEEPSRMLMEV